MTGIREALAEADPLKGDVGMSAERRSRIRAAAIEAGRHASTARPQVSRRAAIAGLTIVMLAGAGAIWQTASVATAAIRFEARLAVDTPGPGLTTVTAPGSGDRYYLLPGAILENVDIASAEVTAGTDGRHGVRLTFTPDGGAKMRQATSANVGKWIAVLLDGEVAVIPRITSAIGDTAVITGDYSRDEAARIATGVIGR